MIPTKEISHKKWPAVLLMFIMYTALEKITFTFNYNSYFLGT